ncbi:hypothetical protein J0A68_10680 [Algoriphagus sp. H41]|uniref:Uncharacterized protein n=1 Tax=Algoriphagus oliviformis TaxID=2811231 RepID=A0ABS3C2T2_9BACT|nr:hypothetical protein [Algoriphagus oliviformis]MBN7811422.1 hypothetical protein [Algoriphagus oliviformis]
MKKLLIFVCLLASQGAYAQISNLDFNGVPARLTPYTGVDGSPYLFPDWGTASVATTNGGVKEGVSYRFDIHTNELEVVNEAGNNIILDKDYLDYVVLERPASQLAQGTTPGLLPKLLFKKGFEFISGVEATDLINVLAEGESYSLVRKFYSDLVTPPKNSYAPASGKMFVFEETFYLINSDRSVTSVKTRANALIKALDAADQDRAKQLIKERKLDLGREDHLVEFFAELNKP